MTHEEIAAILADHGCWLRGEGGKRAVLTGADLSGARLTRAVLTGARLTDARLSGARLTRADLTDADLTRADLTRADLTDARLSGARLTRADLTGADLSGAKINNDKTAIGLLRRATRSDGYEFFLWHCEDGFYIKAGCRFFTLEESRKHWKATRGGTPLGDESQDILDMFNVAITRTEKEA